MTASFPQRSGPLDEPPMPTLSGTPARVFGFNLRSGPLAASEARHAFAAAEDSLSENERQPVLLMLTELVTNAVRHGEGADRPRGVAVKVVESEAGVGAAVTNPGSGFEWHGRDSDDLLEPGGFGLILVDRMASRWGIDRSTGSTTVWFELDRPAV
ncbi:MAG TPA: ATP-binding protein [Thermoleophilaceae bacterium]|nr:ATP-binding protein [Thermoleophilaceae bacterium]